MQPFGPIPEHFRISPPEIDLLIEDLDRERDGFSLYYAVDATEVIEYCFPVKIDFADEPDIDRIAADQTAFDELFVKLRYRPVLIPHYVDELAKYLSFTMATAESDYHDLAISRRLLESAGDPEEFSRLLSTRDINRLSENFTRKLAVWMGLDSIGVDRLRQVISRSLLQLKDIEEGVILNLARDYVPTYASDIFTKLKGELISRPTTTPADRRKLAQRLQAAQTDAAAIDWLVYINSKCIEAAANGGPKCLFLYLSSLSKTRRIFQYLAERDHLPRLADGNSPFRFWRTRHQLLVLATASRNAEKRDYEKIIDNLKAIRRLASLVREVESKFNQTMAPCNDCITKGGSGVSDCEWKEACKLLHEITQTPADISNLGLLAGIRSYANLLRAKPKAKDKADREERLNFLAILRKLVQNRELPDLALREIEDKELFAYTKNVLIQSYPAASQAWGDTAPSSASLTEPLLFLKHTFPRIKQSSYCEIATTAFDYCDLPLAASEERSRLVSDTMRTFLSIDKGIDYPGGRDHELTRLLLFLCFSRGAGLSEVLDRSRKLADRYPESRADFLYVGIMAAKELSWYLDARDLIEEVLAFHSDDPVLYFWRSGNTFRWNKDPQMRHIFAPPLASCPTDAHRALALSNLRPDWPSFESIVLNNLCYFLSYSKDAPFDAIFDLVAARECFDRLMTKHDERGTEAYAEFLHTGANLGLKEAESHAAGWESRLKEARGLIEEAIAIRPRPVFTETKDAIDALVRRIYARSPQTIAKHSVPLE